MGAGRHRRARVEIFCAALLSPLHTTTTSFRSSAPNWVSNMVTTDWLEHLGPSGDGIDLHRDPLLGGVLGVGWFP
jgi:hypothetical protein